MKKLNIFLFVLLDVLGFSLILPLLPFYADEFAVSPSTIGFLSTSNALAQLLMSPIIGRLSDIYGRRPLLLICVFGTFISFILLGTANSVAMLFFSRILDGILGGDISLAQAYIADTTSKEERTKGMGVIGAAFGIGFVCGPAFGGILSSIYGVRYPCFVAAAFSFINFFGIYFGLPESLPPQNRKTQEKKSIEFFPFNKIFKYLKSDKILGAIIIFKFFYHFVFSVFEHSFGNFNKFIGMNASTSSYLLAYVGVVFAIVQGRISAFKSSEKTLLCLGFGLFSLSLFFWSMVNNVNSSMMALTPLGVSCGILNTLLSSLITKNVDKFDQGGALGISASLASLSRVLAPTFTGLTIDTFGITSPAIFCSFLMGIILILSLTNIKLPENTNTNQDKKGIKKSQ